MFGVPDHEMTDWQQRALDAEMELEREREHRRWLQKELETSNTENRHLANNLDVARLGRNLAEAQVKSVGSALLACEYVGKSFPQLQPGIDSTARSVRQAIEETTVTGGCSECEEVS